MVPAVLGYGAFEGSENDSSTGVGKAGLVLRTSIHLCAGAYTLTHQNLPFFRVPINPILGF